MAAAEQHTPCEGSPGGDADEHRHACGQLLNSLCDADRNQQSHLSMMQQQGQLHLIAAGTDSCVAWSHVRIHVAVVMCMLSAAWCMFT